MEEKKEEPKPLTQEACDATFAAAAFGPGVGMDAKLSGRVMLALKERNYLGDVAPDAQMELAMHVMDLTAALFGPLQACIVQAAKASAPPIREHYLNRVRLMLGVTVTPPPPPERLAAINEEPANNSGATSAEPPAPNP